MPKPLAKISDLHILEWDCRARNSLCPCHHTRRFLSHNLQGTLSGNWRNAAGGAKDAYGTEAYEWLDKATPEEKHPGADTYW